MVISEGRPLHPAVITMKRGTTIKADHARIIKHPITGTQILVFGQGPGTYLRHWGNSPIRIRFSIIGKMRDFRGPGRYVPSASHIRSSRQDETGWSEPDPEARPSGRTSSSWGGPDGYDAHRAYEFDDRFSKIMTANMSNVENIRWVGADDKAWFDSVKQNWTSYGVGPGADSGSS
jgi:hypothetical protein